MESCREMGGSPPFKMLYVEGFEGGLPTNAFRMSRNHAASGMCPLCGAGSETDIHILRDFVQVRKVWHRFSQFLAPSHGLKRT